MNRNREEHIAWSKERAKEYAEKGELIKALSSMLSDLREHPETRNHDGLTSAMPMMMSKRLASKEAVLKWIEDFS